MPTHIALLRGVNVGGKSMLAMADLKKLFATLALPNAATLLQSGNVVFDAPAAHDLSALEQRLRDETEKRHKIAPDYFLRTAAEWKAIIARNPFPDAAASDPSHLVVMFCKTTPDRKKVQALQRAIKGREAIAADGRELYITYPDGIGRSKLTNTLIEKSLALRGTAHNWNTIQKLTAMLS